VDNHVSEGLGIVVLETLDDEFDRSVFLVVLVVVCVAQEEVHTMLDRVKPVISNKMV
jgi:hypothetical protein